MCRLKWLNGFIFGDNLFEPSLSKEFQLSDPNIIEAQIITVELQKINLSLTAVKVVTLYLVPIHLFRFPNCIIVLLRTIKLTLRMLQVHVVISYDVVEIVSFR